MATVSAVKAFPKTAPVGAQVQSGEKDPLSFVADYERIKIRLLNSAKPRNFPRLLTGNSSIDEAIGGLPNGLTVFFGEPGGGKSKMAKWIAEAVAVSLKRKPLVAIAEDIFDAPDTTLCHVADYCTYQPSWGKAIDEIKCFRKHLNPPLVVIDSVTNFLSNTTKAVEEADVRSGLWELSTFSQKAGIPLIAVSQIRGEGYSLRAAGGRAVEHAGAMCIRFDRIEVTNSWTSARYNAAEGDVVWSMVVTKDKHGVAQQGSMFRVDYNSKGPVLERVKYRGASKQ